MRDHYDKYEKEQEIIYKFEWYVLNYDFNNKCVENFNIFRSVRFVRQVAELLVKYVTFDDFKDKLKDALRYSFSSKAEYEIMVGDLFVDPEKADLEKIDVYSQVKPNLDTLARYIIYKWNNRPYGKKQLEV